METMKTPSGLVLLALLAMAVCGRAQESCVSCDPQPNCKQVTTLNIKIQQHANLSPYYEQIFSKDYESINYTSICTTFFPMNNSTYMQFRTILYKDNSMSISPYILADLPYTPGVFRVQGLYGGSGNGTTVHNAYVVDASCPNCQPLYIYYKCYLFDTCDFVNPTYDVVNGLSSSTDNSPSCLNRFESLVRSKGLEVEGFVRPPGGPHRCVVYFNNSTCVNADRVDPADAIAYPEQSKPSGC